jgi:DNA primase
VNEVPVITNQGFSIAENAANGTTVGTVVATDPDAAQTKTFSIVSGNTNGAFAINASTGVLSVANSAALNFEVAPAFALIIKVQDNGTGNLSSQVTVTVSLTDVNEAPVISNQGFSIAENAANGTTVGTLVATDPDAAQTKTYSITSGNTNGAFAINTSTGVLSIANSAALNFEVAPTFALIIKVQDNGTGNLSSQATVTVSLTDVNEVPVILNQGFSIAENAANGTTVGTLVATDPDAAQTKTYSITSGNTNGAFAINASTGVLSVVNSAALNFEVAPTFALIIKVQDNGIGNLSSQASVTVSLTDVNEVPVISNQGFSIAENAANGTTVGTVVATDPDVAQTKTFSIASGNTNGAFAINTSTGVLSVANSAALNFEVAPTFALIIKIQDNGTGNLNSQATVTVALTDVNEVPVITNQGFSIAENAANGTTVGTIVATDPDAAQTKTFSIVSGNTNGAFAINASTGMLSVAISAALNFEASPFFALIIKVQDNGTGNLSSQATVTLSLTDVNEVPVISNQGFSIAENTANGTTVGTVVATDPDAGQTKTYSIASGNTNGAFAIYASTGVLSVANSAALNFEVAPSFALIIKVQDNGTGNLSSQATVTVSLTDVNEVPVILNQGFSIAENAANGTTVGTVVATDPDAGQTKTFSIASGNTNGAFAINASTGVLSVANSAALNFGDTTFALIIKVQDNGIGYLSSQAIITASLFNINKAPVISSQTFTVSENSPNGTYLGTIIATDADASQLITFSIVSGNLNGAFAIDASTGLLSVANSAVLNFEETPSFKLVVKVQDNGIGNLSSQAGIAVSLSDINEVPVINNQNFTVSENSANGTSLGTVIATDPDAAQTMTYSIVSGNTNGAFAINASNGILSVVNATALNFEVTPAFTLTVKVQDNGTGNLSSQAAIAVSLIDINEEPVITNQSFLIAENSANGTPVGNILASDPDAGQTKTFAIVSGNVNGAFAIDASTGLLSVANSAVLNFEETPSFNLVVKVQDNGIGNLSSQAGITVSLSDINEVPVINNQNFTVSENSANGTSLGTVIAIDPDAAQTMTYSIVSGNTNGAFAINASNGILSVVNSTALNFEVTPAFTLTVKVQDNGTGNLISQAAIAVSLIDINEEPVITNQSFLIAENSANGNPVGNILASDPDAGQTKTFAIVSGNINGAFTLNAANGLLTIANSSEINFKNNSSFALIVKVEDNGIGSLSSQAIITISMTDINEAPVISNQAFSVAENTANGTTIGNVIAYDPDAGQTMTFSIESGNTNGAFAINASTGVLSIANSSFLNFEISPAFTLVVKVQDNGTGNLSNQASIMVSLTDVNETPIINNQIFSVAENADNGTFIGTVIASDPDVAQILTFSIVSGNTNNAYAINATTGALTITNSAALNFEVTPSFVLVIKIQDNGIGNLSSQATVTTSLLYVNEVPVINNQIFAISENAANGTTVGTVFATDPDAGQTLTYAITSGNSNNAFSINSSTGKLYIIDSTAIDYNINPVYFLGIKVSDNGPTSLSDTAIAYVIVIPGPNQAPVITDQTLTLIQSSPTGTSIGIVEAADPDLEQLLSYSILSGNTEGLFSMNPSTGEIFVANSDALSLNSALSYQLQIQVQDNGPAYLSSQAIITVIIVKVITPPVILSQTMSTTEHQPIGTIVGNIAATNSKSPLTYSIISGNIDNAFAIDNKSSSLTINNPAIVCFEGHPVIKLTVKAQDTVGLSSEALISINVTDVNEKPICDKQVFTISENTPAQTLIGSLIAKDFDFNQTLTYSIVSGNINNAFTINPGNGILKVNNPEAINFEITEYFSLVVSVQDNGLGNLTTFSTITVALLDVNEPPVMENQALSVIENPVPGTQIGFLRAKDPDKGQKVKYMIASGNDGYVFNVNDTSGLISVADPSKLAYGRSPLFALTIIAQDNGIDSLSTLSVVTINVVKDSSQSKPAGAEIPVQDAFTDQDITIYPNPTADIVNINLEKALDQTVYIRIFSLSGSEIYSSVSKGGEKVEINMGNESPGTYVADLSLNGQTYTRKIVVQ